MGWRRDRARRVWWGEGGVGGECYGGMRSWGNRGMVGKRSGDGQGASCGGASIKDKGWGQGENGVW